MTGMTQAESPEWMPACSMCSMIAPTTEVSPSEMQSTSTSVASVEEAVHEHRALGRGDDGLAHVAGEFGVAVDDHHGAAAEDEGRADEHRVADALGDDEGFLLVGGGAGFGLLEVELVEQGGEELAVLGQFDGLRRGADDGDAVAFEIGREVQRRLAAELDDDAVRLVPGRRC